MKKNLFMVAAVALMALVSCNKEELGNNSNGVVFVAELEQDASTKTTLGTDRKAHWEVNDEIKINGTVFTANKVGPESSFTTTAENFDVTATPFRAVYPASSYISNAAVDIPANQDGQFASASIAVAESSDQYLKFQNLSSILKFQVPVACNEVKIESSASLAGRITVNYSNGDMSPDYAGVTQPRKAITVAGDFVPETDYYVAVKPDTHTLTVSIDGKDSKASTKSVTLDRSKIYNLGVLPEPKKNVRLYIESEKTGFDMKIYAWGLDDVTLPNEWPGESLSWDSSANKYYYDFPLEVKDRKISFIVNVNADSCKSNDLEQTFNNYEETYSLNWKWLYLKPNSNWKQSSAKFAAYFFTKNVSGEYWQWMMKLDNDNYGCLIPPGSFKNVIFCRMNSSATEMKWDNKWNQTADLTIPTDGKNLYTVTPGWWDNSDNNQWSTK